MNNATEYLAPIIGFHLSLLFGILSYACKYCDRNSLFGVRTAYTLKSDEDWREVNHRVARVVPPVSGIAGLGAMSGLAFRPMRSAGVVIALIAVQFAAVILATMRRTGTR